jgi:hypothetical protein
MTTVVTGRSRRKAVQVMVIESARCMCGSHVIYIMHRGAWLRGILVDMCGYGVFQVSYLSEMGVRYNTWPLSVINRPNCLCVLALRSTAIYGAFILVFDFRVSNTIVYKTPLSPTPGFASHTQSPHVPLKTR